MGDKEKENDGSRNQERRRPSFDILEQETDEYKALMLEASLYLDLIDECEEEGRIPGRRDFIRISEQLKDEKLPKHYNTVRSRFTRFLEAGYDGLRDLTPGPIAGHKLTNKQLAVIEGMCLKRKFDGIEIEGVKTYVIRRADIEEIYKEVIRVNRGEENVSQSTVEREIRRWVDKNTPAITLAHEGDAEFEKKHQPKTRNIVPGPNYRWIWDMRLLPILVDNEGVICRVIASAIEDSFSGYPINCDCIPQKELFDDNLEKKVDFIVLTARRQFAGAIDDLGVRSFELYTDNGSVFRKQLQMYLDVLTYGTTRLRIRHSRAGHPQGRGPIEKFLHLLDRIIVEEKWPGYLEETTNERIEEVSKLPLLTFEQFMERLNKAMEKLRKKPRQKGGKESRETVWKSDLSHTLPAPASQRLYMFANTVKQYRAKVYGRGVYREKTYFVPVKRTYETEQRLTDLDNQYVPLRLAMWKDKLFAFVSLDGSAWTPFEPRETHVDDLEEFMRLRNAVRRDKKKANRISLERLDALMREEHGGQSVDDFMDAEAERLSEQERAKTLDAGMPVDQGGGQVPPKPINAPEGEEEPPASDEANKAEQDELAAMLKRLRESFQPPDDSKQ